ncbi:MAG: secondary thiamine-phosphate synthase enzyme YjbQ [bacterium]
MSLLSEPVKLSIQTTKRAEAIDITAKVEAGLPKLEVGSGINIWVPHTTAGVTVNEAADPAVMADLISQLEEFIPWENNYRHREGNSAAHVKSVLLDWHQWIPVKNNSLGLGRWQGIFFMEWDGPRNRTCYIYPD